MKRENLTKTETTKLRDFVGNVVMNNVVFPPTQMGASSITIQELLHSRTTESLGKYADFLETQSDKISRTDRLNGVKEKTISGSDITFTEVIEVIDLIIKHKLALEQAAYVEKKKIEIKKENS